jgi:cleavage stimulation factor subunit 1
VYSAAFHPSGDYVVAGTEHHMVRLFQAIVSLFTLEYITSLYVSQAHIYDVETLQCFTPSVSESHHVGGINQVCCAGDGKQFATAGKDGTVKLWDIVSSTCIATLDSAHDKMVRIDTVLHAWPEPVATR